MTTRVLILAGGQSAEHSISIKSAQCVFKAIAQAPTLEASVRVLTKDGRVLSAIQSAQYISTGEQPNGDGEPLANLLAALQHIDVVLPLLHGPMGEDGTVQGLLTLMGVPFVGCGVLASALCMDKPMAKEVLRSAGVPQVPYITVTRHEVMTAADDVVKRIEKNLRMPLFVKPANMGSSVGITKVSHAAELPEALALACRHDRRIIVEQGLDKVRELEIAVLGNDTPTASVVGEICHDGSFYDFATKYTVGRSHMVIPAQVPEQVSEKIVRLSCEAYRLLDCAGLARIDFFYEPQGQAVFLNEVNTMPGFTEFSMFPGLFAASGLNYGQLIERLVQLALQRHPHQPLISQQH